MAGLSDKVVRVEQLMSPDVERADSLLGDGLETAQYVERPSKGAIVASDDTSALKEYKQYGDDYAEEEEEEEIASSEQDSRVSTVASSDRQLAVVRRQPLPEGWPKISQLQDKHSWDYYTLLSPSINKATSHLELLQTVIEEWVKENATSEPRGSSKAASRRSRHTTQGSRQQISFSGVHHDAGPSPQLSVLGVGAQANQPAEQVAVAQDIDDELPYLGAEEVIEEVITLLAKIETDRRDTLDALKSEDQRVNMLRTKIDELAMKRLLDLPKAVQKEHEDCAMDISELNWHVSYRGRILDRNNNRVAVADKLYTRLNEDIAFVNKHIPLVKEKLDLEVDAMDRIKQAQLDTNEELDTTIQRCSKVEAKSAEAHAKANEERKAIKQDLDAVQNDLTQLSNELSQAKMTFNTYTHQCSEFRQQLTDNDQELKLLLVKDENIKAAEAMQNVKVRELEAQIKQREIECRRLEEENSTIQNKIDTNKANFGKKEKELRGKIEKKTESLRQLTRQNDELTMDVEDLDTKSRDCDRQKIADEKNLERMQKELARTEEQINETKDDLANVSIINNAVRDQLRKEEERCLQAEEALRSTTEGLKKQVKEEIHSRTVLVARIQTDGSDLVNAQEEAKVKCEIIDKKVSEVNNAVKSILGKVEKLRSFHQEKTKLIANINGELQKIADIKKDIETTCNRQRSELLPQHKKQKEILLDLEKKLDHMVWKTDMMTKKVKEMDESSVMMEKSVTKTTKMIKELEADLAELNIQIETGEKMEQELKTSLTQSVDRISDTESIQTDHMHARNKVFEDHQTSLEYNIALNKQLASHYRSLQNRYVVLKNKMLDNYEERVKLENAIKDLKQLKGLQKRMHNALMAYFKYRGLYNQGELGRMDHESHTNGIKVGRLQDEMDHALDSMAHFLHHQVDGDTIRKMAMAKVDEEERMTTRSSEGQGVTLQVKVESTRGAAVSVS